MKPKVSVITSFSVAGFADAVARLRHGQIRAEYVELYAFMQDDLQAFWPSVSVAERTATNALQAMAGSSDSQEQVDRIASKIHEDLKGVQVAAFATYLPELTAVAKNARLVEDARRALVFLVHLADALARKGHPIATIEIVGGSTVDGLWRGQTTAGEETYVVNRRNPDAALTRLAERLIPVARYIVEKEIPLRLALELEPGPLFNLCTKNSLLKMCQLIDADEWLTKVVGFNLDIPHWCFLAGINLNWLRQHPLIKRRIAHAHVSDHSRGHFCDAEPCLFHGASDFGPWFRLLSELRQRRAVARQNGGLAYSGFVSCELECCQDEARVAKALATLNELVEKYCA